ncbi:MAG: DUF1592 domain-containing protein [Phycisphaerales bacterium]|nr:DUF1592 domain-containing protein [Phycisphaerales bacterium]
MRPCLQLCLCCAAGACFTLPVEADWQSFANAHCVDCHVGASAKGGLDLEALPLEAATVDDLRAWDQIRARLQAQDMPPRADFRPPPSEYEAVLHHVEQIIDAQAQVHAVAGSPAGRRLNRYEWQHAVLDTLGVHVDVNTLLPADDIGHGFDTVGDTLSLSPPLLERYIEAAEVAAAAAMQDPDNAVFDTIRVDAADLDITGAGTRRGNRIHMHSSSAAVATFDVPRTSRYRIVADVFGKQAGEDPVRFAVIVNDEPVGTIDVPQSQPTEHAIEVNLNRGPTTISVGFINDFYRPNHPDPNQRDRNAAVVAVSLVGPLDEPRLSAFQQQFPVEASLKVRHADLRAIVNRLLPRLWRGQQSPGDVNRIVRLAWDPDRPWPAQVRAALMVMLSHPKFLLRMEQDPEEGHTERALSGNEIAARMALLVWSSVPDDILLQAAADGSLNTPNGRATQLHRMLDDPRGRRLAAHFAPQWLQIRRLDTIVPDPEQYPGVDAALRQSMLEETVGMFDTVLRGGGTWQDLLQSPESTVSPALAAHYGIAHKNTAAHVSRTGPACGVLTHASVLLATSNPTRTSPVKRGKWVLEALLDAPPPPPPPGVDGLPDDGRGDDSASLRQLLMKHRADPNCSTCHERMDELGFAMERYNVVGLEVEDADDLGQLPGGVPLEGMEGLRDWVLSTDALPRSLARHALTYAVGRGFDVLDEHAIDAVAARLIEAQTLRSLLEAVIEARPFLYRGAPS